VSTSLARFAPNSDLHFPPIRGTCAESAARRRDERAMSVPPPQQQPVLDRCCLSTHRWQVRSMPCSCSYSGRLVLVQNWEGGVHRPRNETRSRNAMHSAVNFLHQRSFQIQLPPIAVLRPTTSRILTCVSAFGHRLRQLGPHGASMTRRPRCAVVDPLAPCCTCPTPLLVSRNDHFRRAPPSTTNVATSKIVDNSHLRTERAAPCTDKRSPMMWVVSICDRYGFCKDF